jgi:predicted RNA binding protein YcfA (HicA-like mRNA interferase family)
MFVMGAEKTLGRLLSGAADAAIRFDDLCQLLESLGFEKRVRGSHHLFRKSGVEERITFSGQVRTRNRTKLNRSGR